MLKAFGVHHRFELLLFIAIVALVAITPAGREATSPAVFWLYRLLLVAITFGSIAILENKREPDICPIYISLCGLTLLLILGSILWNPGSRFNGFYHWYQYLLFGAAFLSMAAMHRERNAHWKRALLGAVVAVSVTYVAVTLPIGART